MVYPFLWVTPKGSLDTIVSAFIPIEVGPCPLPLAAKLNTNYSYEELWHATNVGSLAYW